MKDIRGRLHVGDPDDWLKFCKKKYLSKRPLEVQTVEDGIILPVRPKVEKKLYNCMGGVCDRDFKFIAGYDNQGANKGHIHIDASYKVARDELEQSNEEVIFGGALIYHFGHFMVECTSRLWYLIKNPSVEKKIVFIPMGQWSFQPWIYEFLKLIDLPEDRIVILDKPTQFKSVTVPDQAVYIIENYAAEFLLPFQKMLSKIRPVEGIGKIFLSRSKGLNSARTFFNQEYFEEFYRRRGFEIVYPEQLSMVEQISIISGADEVVTFLGTLSHWALFCRPTIEFTILVAVDNNSAYPTIVRQSLINEASGVDWRYVSVDGNFLLSAHTSGPSIIGSTEQWRRYVKEQFGETLEEEAIPTGLMSEYIRRWCRFFADAEPRRLETLKNIYNRMTALEEEMKTLREEQCNGRERIEGAHLRSQL